MSDAREYGIFDHLGHGLGESVKAEVGAVDRGWEIGNKVGDNIGGALEWLNLPGKLAAEGAEAIFGEGVISTVADYTFNLPGKLLHGAAEAAGTVLGAAGGVLVAPVAGAYALVTETFNGPGGRDEQVNAAVAAALENERAAAYENSPRAQTGGARRADAGLAVA